MTVALRHAGRFPDKSRVWVWTDEPVKLHELVEVKDSGAESRRAFVEVVEMRRKRGRLRRCVRVRFWRDPRVF